MTSEKDASLDGIKELYRNMYEERRKNNPEALQLQFWKDHFSTITFSSMPEVVGNILDLGCGTGEIDIWLARTKSNISISGVDISSEALQIARNHLQNESIPIQNSINFYESTFDNLPFEDSTFDCCIISHTLEHIKNYDLLFAELYRVMKDCASIIIVVPYRNYHDDPTHLWHYDDQELETKMQLYGENVKTWLSPDGQQIACSMKLRHKPKIICMMRIKNEEEWIKRTIEKASKLVTGFVILDDGSTDNTREVCRSINKLIAYEYQNLPDVDEVRDKNKLLKITISYDPEWILCLDGDEVLEDTATNTIIREILLSPESVTKIGFTFLYMWDSETQFRKDGIYNNIRHPRLFKVVNNGIMPELLSFTNTNHGGNFHCGSVPSNLPGALAIVDVRVKHYGYFHKEQREMKKRFYEENDPSHSDTGYYDHLTGGNIVCASYEERTAECVLYSNDSPLQLINRLKKNDNPLWQSAMFYLPGSKSHLDIGSNTGNTLRGLDKDTITCIEAYKPAVDQLRLKYNNVIHGDAREILRELLLKKIGFDRITLFDFIEHLNKNDGLELLHNVEEIANREIIFFVPMENDNLVKSDKYKNFMDGIYQNIPNDQHDLQSHRSIWTPEEFKTLGYETVILENLHFEGFHAFFAFKYVFETDKEMFYKRIQNFQKIMIRENDARKSEFVTTSKEVDFAFNNFGKNSRIINPLLITNPQFIHIGDNVSIRDGARIEAINEYAGVKYNPQIIIDNDCSIELSTHIGAANYVYLGKKVMIAGRVTILDHDHGYENIYLAPIDQPLCVGRVIIEDGVWLGENVVVCKNVKIGKNSVVGANSVVTKSIPPFSIAAGNPAKVIKTYNFQLSAWEKVESKIVEYKLIDKCPNDKNEDIVHKDIANSLFLEILQNEKLIEQGRINEAWESLIKLNQKHQLNTDILNNLATIKIIQKKYSEAIQIIEQVLRIDNQNVIAINNLQYINDCIAIQEKVQIQNKNNKSNQIDNIHLQRYSKRPTISVNLIVFNEVDFIELWLRNTVDYVDEIIIIDGGSTDGTIELIKAFSSNKIKLYVWQQDASWYSEGWNESARRNLAIIQSSCDWILKKDIDEFFLESDYEKIRQTIAFDQNMLYCFPRYSFWGDINTIRLNTEDDPHWYPDYQGNLWKRKLNLKYSSDILHSYLCHNGEKYEKTEILNSIHIYHYHWAIGDKIKINDLRRMDLLENQDVNKVPADDKNQKVDLTLLNWKKKGIQTVVYSGTHPKIIVDSY